MVVVVVVVVVVAVVPSAVADGEGREDNVMAARRYAVT